MLRTLLAVFILTATTQAQAMDLQTARHPLCGVESYNTRTDAQCGVATYREARSPDCGVEHYNARLDPSCPGSHQATRPIPYIAICTDPSGICPWDDVVAECEKPEFGVASYKSCRTQSNGVEAYNSCSLPQFGVAAYRSCSFYLTPEQLDEYLNVNASSVEFFATLLPGRQAELLSRLREAASFACLVRKYQALTGYETVVDDLAQKFFVTFGYKVQDYTANCSSEILDDPARQVKVTITGTDNTLACDNLTPEAIDSAAAPAGVSETAMQHFKQSCTLKLSYAALLSWFHLRSTELQQLSSDIVAKQDPSIAARIAALEAKINSVNVFGGSQ